jgi:hypothetical protein
MSVLGADKSGCKEVTESEYSVKIKEKKKFGVMP